MLKKFWKDEVGAVVTAELVLVVTILVVGCVVALTALRDAIVTELADFAGSVASLNQSYSYSGVLGHSASCSGSFFTDGLDTCDDMGSQPAGNSRCVTICAVAAEPEN